MEKPRLCKNHHARCSPWGVRRPWSRAQAQATAGLLPQAPCSQLPPCGPHGKKPLPLSFRPQSSSRQKQVSVQVKSPGPGLPALDQGPSRVSSTVLKNQLSLLPPCRHRKGLFGGTFPAKTTPRGCPRRPRALRSQQSRVTPLASFTRWRDLSRVRMLKKAGQLDLHTCSLASHLPVCDPRKPVAPVAGPAFQGHLAFPD